MTAKSVIVATARRYVSDRGFTVIPIHPRTKKPAIKWKNGDVKDHPDKSTEQIERWWREQPLAQLGALTGKPSKIVTIDVDTLTAHGKDGFEALDRWEAEHGKLPTTPTTRTPSGGRQLHFAYPKGLPDGAKIKSTTDIFGPKCGVDSRGDGGIVVLPPSDFGKGPYRWLGNPDEVIAELPEALIHLLLVLPKAVASRGCNADDSDNSASLHLDVLDDCLSRLKKTCADSYDDWIKLGMILRSTSTEPATDDAERYKRWLDWSQQSEKFDAAVCAEKWETFSQTPDLVGVGTLICWAREDSGDPGIGKAKQANKFSRKIDSYRHNDLGNAERLLDVFGDDLSFSEGGGDFVWDGKRWLPNRHPDVQGMAVRIVRAIHDEAAELAKRKRKGDENRAEELHKHASRSGGSARIEGMIAVARGVAAEHGRFVYDIGKTFDTHPMLLNVLNGTLDLETGKLRPHRRRDKLTKITPVVYDPNATCPLWDETINLAMQDDAEMIGFLHRYFGYALTGMTNEQCFAVFYGTGENLKTTIVEAVAGVLGDYATNTSIDTFMVKPAGGIPNDVAALRGARLVTATETEEGKHLSEVLIKQITGGDRMTARFMRQEFFDFTPVCKVIISGNHKPVLRGTDHGLWRRPQLVEFGFRMPADRRDKGFPLKLRAEYPGLLAWLVRGCQAWLAGGLRTPEKVRAATAAYRADMDVLGQWLMECCQTGDGYAETGGKLYQSYTFHTKNSGLLPLSNPRFTRQLEERRFVRDRSTGVSLWMGVKLTPEAAAMLTEGACGWR